MAKAKTAPEKILAICDAAASNPEAPARAIADVTGVPVRTVRELLHKYAPVTNELKDYKRDYLTGMWQGVAVGALDRLYNASHSGEPGGSRTAVDWAKVAGIATDKVLLMHGMPTSMVGVVGEIRLSMADIAQKLLRVSGEVIEG